MQRDSQKIPTQFIWYQDPENKKIFLFLKSISSYGLNQLNDSEYSQSCLFNLLEDINIIVYFYEAVSLLNQQQKKMSLFGCMKEILSSGHLVFSQRTAESIKARNRFYLSVLTASDLFNIANFYINILNGTVGGPSNILQVNKCSLFLNRNEISSSLKIQYQTQDSNKIQVYKFINFPSDYHGFQQKLEPFIDYILKKDQAVANILNFQIDNEQLVNYPNEQEIELYQQSSQNRKSNRYQILSSSSSEASSDLNRFTSTHKNKNESSQIQEINLNRNNNQIFDREISNSEQFLNEINEGMDQIMINESHLIPGNFQTKQSFEGESSQSIYPESNYYNINSFPVWNPNEEFSLQSKQLTNISQQQSILFEPQSEFILRSEEQPSHAQTKRILLQQIQQNVGKSNFKLMDMVPEDGEQIFEWERIICCLEEDYNLSPHTCIRILEELKWDAELLLSLIKIN